MTQQTYAYEPDYAVPPGLVLEEHLESWGLSQAEFARRCGRSPKLISEIIAGKARLGPETALQFERVLGVDASIWLNIESTYQIHERREAEAKAAKAHLDWAKQFPIKELVRREIITPAQDTADYVPRLLAFLGVASVETWNSRVAAAQVQYRHSPSFESGEAVLAAWLRLGELEAKKQQCATFNMPKTREALRQIRTLTRQTTDSAMAAAKEALNAAGIALVVVKPFSGMSVNGATWWLSPQKAVILLTLRGMTNDHVWFSLFHEAAHILLHSKRLVFVESRNGPGDELEQEADKWAANTLIGPAAWSRFVNEDDFTAPAVKRFADRQGIAPSIVAGRLQHEKLVPYNRLNGLKERLEWTQA